MSIPFRRVPSSVGHWPATTPFTPWFSAVGGIPWGGSGFEALRFEGKRRAVSSPLVSAVESNNMKLLLLLLRHPFAAVRFTYTWLAQSLLVLLRRALLPHLPSYQPLRLQLQRAYLSSASVTFPDLTHRLPVGPVLESRARYIRDSGFEAYLVPGASSRLLEQGPERGRRRCIALYAHGGGYARGEAKMYLNYMERWVSVAAAAGVDLAFLSLEYRK